MKFFENGKCNFYFQERKQKQKLVIKLSKR